MKKNGLISVLFLILMFLSLPTFAQTLTARAAVERTDPVAKAWAADAELIFIGTAVEPGMYSDGTADGWVVGYYSAAENVARNYYGAPAGNVSFEDKPKDGYPSLEPIGSEWKDSDEAAAIAENNQGGQFRAEHTDWIVAASLTHNVRSTYGVVLPGAHWDITYWSPGAEKIWKIQLDGSALEPPPRWITTIKQPQSNLQFTIALTAEDTIATFKLTSGTFDSLFIEVFSELKPPDSFSKKAVYRYFKLTPFPTNAVFELEMSLYYYQEEYDLSGIEDESGLKLFRHNGEIWELAGGEASMVHNRIYIEGVSTLSLWAFANPLEQPLLVESESLPETFSLSQNYPNPFNPQTTIRFCLKKSDPVKLTLFNMLGHEVAQLVNGSFAAGEHEILFDAAGLSSGIYLYTLETKEFRSTKKMILSK